LEKTVIVIRFKVKCAPGKAEQLMAVFQRCIEPSRAIGGVVHFDIARDLLDSDAFIATEVFEDREALDRQEAQPVIHEVLGLLGDVLAEPPEATIFHVSSSEPYGG
jgi:quinol monooxygenase YgiN